MANEKPQRQSPSPAEGQPPHSEPSQPVVAAPSFFPQWAQDLNVGLSFVGFFITLWVLYDVRRIRASFVARARLPALMRDIAKAGSTLNGHLQQWPEQRNPALGQIKVAAALLKTSVTIAPKSERRHLSRIHRKLTLAVTRASASAPLDEEAAWDMYSDIQSCLTSLDQAVKNLKWE